MFQELRRDDCALNLRTYRASMSVLAECGKGKEALMYLQEMKVGVLLLCAVILLCAVLYAVLCALTPCVCVCAVCGPFDVVWC